jgi:hypothetical protein
MNLKKIGSETFLFFELKLDNIQTEISRKNFNRARNPGAEKNFGPGPFERSKSELNWTY